MKFDISKPKDIKSQLSTDSFSAEIADPKMMMNIVRDKLYAHKLRTPIQEYISNAWDSHVAAGNTTRGIKIVLPTTLEPVLKIRDYGTGMSDEKVRKTFSQYTASDKRQNLNQIGGFGLGSKSAFAYTDKFTILSFYQGKQNTYIAYAPSELDLEFSPFGSEDTTEENGVEIQIAIKPVDIAACYRYVLRMILLLPVKTELVNGAHLMDLREKFKTEAVLFDTNEFTIYPSSKLSSDLISSLDMNDNVFISYNHIPYQVPAKYLPEFKAIRELTVSPYVFELKAAMNSLQIPPAREMLVDDEALASFIKEQAQKISAWFKAKKEEEVKEIKAQSSFKELKNMLPKLLCVHEEAISVEIKVNNNPVEFVVQKNRYYSHQIHYNIHIHTKEEFLVVNKKNKRRNSSTVVVDYDYRKALSEKASNYTLDTAQIEKWYTTTGSVEELSAENIAKFRYIFKSDSSLSSIYIFKAESTLAGLIPNRVENFSLPKNAKLVPEYYNVYHSALNLGQVNFSPKKEYVYAIMNEENKENLECSLPSWVRDELENSGKILIYIPQATEASLINKKNFKKLDVTAYENRDPRNVKFSKKQLKALAFIEELERYRYGRGFDDFIKISRTLNSSDVQDPWLKDVLENREIVKDLNTKYKMNLFSMPRDQKIDGEKLEAEVKAFMETYPLLKAISTYSLSEHHGSSIADYLNLAYARNTGILKSE